MTISRSEMAELVNAWNTGADLGHDPRVRMMVSSEVQRINRAFEELPVRVQFVDHDPYQSFEQMRDQIRSTGTMLVWKGASETPLWSPETNWKARAVHDWDHIVHSLDFSMEGEAAAFRKSAQRTPGLERLYLSEIMLQAAVQNYTGNFAAQKLVLVSPEMLRKAGQMRGLDRGPATPDAVRAVQQTAAADAVWNAAGLLNLMSPAELAIHLRAQGYSFDEAVVIIDAAQMLANQRA